MKIIKNSSGTIILLLSVLLLTGFAMAQEEKEPTAVEILSAYIEATGGVKAHSEIYNRTTNSIISIPSENLSFNLIIREAKPTKSYSKMSSFIRGQVEKGCDGLRAWQRNEKGVEILSGQEKYNILRNSIFDKYINWHKGFGKAEFRGRESEKGKEFYKIVLTPIKLGKDDVIYNEVLYFDIETGLLVKTVTHIPSGEGMVEVTAVLSDYRSVNGIKLPFKAIVTVQGQPREITVLRITHNTVISSSTFKVPFR